MDGWMGRVVCGGGRRECCVSVRVGGEDVGGRCWL